MPLRPCGPQGGDTEVEVGQENQIQIAVLLAQVKMSESQRTRSLNLQSPSRRPKPIELSISKLPFSGWGQLPGASLT